jgi:DNA-binding transcriptional ArsR family regulator
MRTGSSVKKRRRGADEKRVSKLNYINLFDPLCATRIVPHLPKGRAYGMECKLTMSKRTEGVTEQDLEQLGNLFRLLSDKTRLNIVFLLSDGERNVTSLCEELKLPQPTVSHHLGLLRMSNVIGNRRNGKQVFDSLNGRVDVLGRGALQVDLENFSINVTPRESFGA